MTARIGNITFDCDDVLKMATFWSAVLGRPLDKGSTGQSASIGGTGAARRARVRAELRRGHGELAADIPARRHLRAAFGQLALVI